MSEKQSSRRKFLQFLGLSAGATLVSSSGMTSTFDEAAIMKLNPTQQEFMNRYGEWMNEFIEVIKMQKSDPENAENHKKRILLTEKAELFQPELIELMKDDTFSMIYKASIERMTKEI